MPQMSRDNMHQILCDALHRLESQINTDGGLVGSIMCFFETGRRRWVGRIYAHNEYPLVVTDIVVYERDMRDDLEEAIRQGIVKALSQHAGMIAARHPSDALLLLAMASDYENLVQSA